MHVSVFSKMGPSASLTGSHERNAAFQELCSEMLPRGCHKLSRAQITNCCYSFMWAWMTLQTRAWLKSRSSTDPWGSKWIILVPRLSFFPILPVGGKVAARNRWIMHINFWLCDQCPCEGLRFYDHGMFFADSNQLEGEEINLSRRGKGISGSQL